MDALETNILSKILILAGGACHQKEPRLACVQRVNSALTRTVGGSPTTAVACLFYCYDKTRRTNW